MPGIGISIFITAVGAIMRYAVSATAEGVDLHMIGVILMFVGIGGLLLSLLFWTSLSPWNRNGTRGRTVETVERDVR